MSEPNASDIAVIGMAGRFPGAPDNAAYWRMLAEGREGVRDLTEAEALAAGADPVRVKDPNYVRSVSGLPDPFTFDAEFFGFSASQASITDPQVRVFLELAWTAIEDAGYTPASFGGNIGVYAGSSFSTYLYEELVPNLDGEIEGLLTSAGMRAMVGNDKDYITTWISYQLDLRGPSVAVYTACSTSLVAIHSACSALLGGECDMALAGGIKVRPNDMKGYTYEEGSLVSPDGRCRAFDADALGTIFGHGGGIVVLRRLEDALRDGDRVLAIVKATAINNDGNAKVGFTAPGVRGQVEVVSAALALAGVSADSISYVEAHGTGTAMGDPIEVSALTRAFRRTTRRNGYCAIGSVKTNIGHLESGAGVAGFIKTVLALNHEQIPPSLNYHRPNPGIDFERSPFFVNTSLRPWPRGPVPRRACVSSFGIGGTNAHIILEEAPIPDARTGPAERPVHLLCLSAKTPAALARQLDQHAEALLRPDAPDLADAAYTAHVGRVAMEHRVAVVGRDAAALVARLRSLRTEESGPAARKGRAGEPRVAFLYDGQGAGFPAMGAELYETCPPFRAELDRLAGMARRHGLPDLVALLCDPARGPDLEITLYAQPALAALELALTALWRSWGLQPVAVLGHSLGEVVAACVAGVYDAEACLGLVIARARAMHALAPGGAMAAVHGPEAEVLAAIAPWTGRIGVAAINSPEAVVISGEAEALDEAGLALEARGLRVRRLAVSAAFHSHLIDPALPAISLAAAGISHSAPRLPLISNLSGEALTTPDQGWPDYWVRHARSPVRFAAGLARLRALGVDTLVEIGPGTALLGMARSVLETGLLLPSLKRDSAAWETLLDSLGQLWTAGAAVDLAGLDAPWTRRRVAIPTYPFERRDHLPPRRKARKPAAPRSGGHPLRGSRLDAAVTLYEGRVDLAEQPWLADHVVGEAPILPGTAMLEIAGSAAFELSGAFSLRDVSFRAPMPLDPEQPRAVQLAVDEDGGWRLFSRTEGAPWSHHSSGRTGAGSALSEVSVLADWQAECPDPLDPGLPYSVLASRNIHFGERFRAVTALWRRPADASGVAVMLARLQLPAGLSTDGLLAHPVLLDGCFQTAIAGFPADRPGPPVVPIAIDEVRVHGPLAAALWCRAEMPTDFGGDGKANLYLCDEQGRLRVELLGLQGATLAAPARQDRLFRLVWRARPTPPLVPLPTPSALRAALQPQHAAIAASISGIWTEALEAQLDQTVAWAAGNLFADMSWGEERYTEAALAEALRVLPAHRRVFHRMLSILIEDGALAEEDESLTTFPPHPAFGHLLPQGEGEKLGFPLLPEGEGAPIGADEGESPSAQQDLFAKVLVRTGPWPARPPEGLALDMPEAVVRLIEGAARRLGPLLRGEDDPLELLFPGGSLEVVEQIYVRSPVALAWNQIVGAALRALVASTASDQPLRVLEVGGGTGSSTAVLLPLLPPERSTYVFTDISRHFLTRAEQRFSAFPFLQTRLLDIDRPLAEQGLQGERYDVVVANNVLHATADLRETLGRVRELLSPGGIVIIAEAIRPQRWTDLTFGLTEGWWRFRDGLRTTNPIATVAAWRQALADAGFDDAGDLLPDAVTAADGSGHAVILGRVAPALVALGAPVLDEARAITLDEVASLSPGSTLLLGPLELCQPEDDRVTTFPPHPPLSGHLLPEGEGGPLRGTRPDEGEKSSTHQNLRGRIPGPPSLSTDPAQAMQTLAAARTQVLEFALRAAQALPPSCRLRLLTRGGASVDGEACDPVQSALWAMGLVLRTELGERYEGQVDLDAAVPLAQSAPALRAELAGPREEPRVALRGERHVARVIQVTEPTQAPWSPRPDGTYLVSGGLGGIGLRLSRWLASDGAGAVVLLGRSAPSPEAEEELAAQRASGARVEVLQVDVCDGAALTAALEQIRATLPPLRGIFHAAGVLSDARLPDMEAERFHAVLRPKMDGAWLLHALTLSDPLEQFVLFSSGSSIYGTSGQTNHAAANGFLDGLAEARRAAGLPAISVNFGRWSDVGVVRDPAIGLRLEAQGVLSFTADEGIDVLRRLLARGDARALFSPVDRQRWRVPGDPLVLELPGLTLRKVVKGAAERWSLEQWSQAPAAEREGVVARWLQGQVGEIVGLAADQVALDLPANAAGLDSLMAVELRGRLSRALDVPVSVGDLLAVGSLRESAGRLHAALAARAMLTDTIEPNVEWEEISL